MNLGDDQAWQCSILISGTMSMAVEDALTEQDKADGYVLTYQAKIRGEVKVDASGLTGVNEG